jgi:tetratricopeptide (TPR) repeat protein
MCIVDGNPIGLEALPGNPTQGRLIRASWRLWTILALFLVGTEGCGRNPVEQHAGHNLGRVDFPVSCSEQAAVEFNRAVSLLHHMTYPQARKAFEQVATTDRQCAMAHWGVAMTLFQPLWPTRPGPEALQRGWQAVEKAKQLKPATERERLFVAATEGFFREPTSTDYWQRIHKWGEGMEALHAAYPNDPEVACFYALALLATAPSNAVSLDHSDRAAKILLAVYEQNPEHPGVMHYLIHANDVPGREAESLEIVRKYETIAPRNAHALHMPTHIYTRLGDWEGVIRGNLQAAEAALEAPAGDRGEFVWDEFPHAIEYLVYAYLQKGEDEDAEAQLKRLRATANLEPTFKTAFHLASTQARYALERHAWSEAALLVPRDPPTLDWDRFMWPEAVTNFARGLGAARLGRVEESAQAVKRLEELAAAAEAAGENLFARSIRVLGLEADAWLAQARQDSDSSVALMRQAAELEASTPKHAVTPGPTLPALELSGDLFIELGRPAEALAAYKRSLTLYPRRFNSLLGAARAARAVGDETQALAFYRELLGVAAGGTRPVALQEAQNFASGRR